jgi:glycosyltransferase involved in cell wall biosynthesis
MDFLMFEGCDFERFPLGGQLNQARTLMQAFGGRIGLVGISTDNTPVGQWVEKTFDGVPFPFFSVARFQIRFTRPLVPARVRIYLGTRRHRRAIMARAATAAFTQNPEMLIAMSAWGWDRLCYWFPGVHNAMTDSRYPWARHLSGLFDRHLFAALERCDAILAAADDRAIDGFVARSGGRFARDRILKFPTRVDTSLFRPADRQAARRALGIAPTGPLFVNVARIATVKGWELVLRAFHALLRRRPDVRLCFVGDGEERAALEACIAELGVQDRVSLAGRVPQEEIVRYLNAADVALVGSFSEGWCTAMLEAAACGTPVVTTAVSGSADLVREGETGYVVAQRDPDPFARAMERALALPPTARDASVEIARAYAVETLEQSLGKVWLHRDQGL